MPDPTLGLGPSHRIPHQEGRDRDRDVLVSVAVIVDALLVGRADGDAHAAKCERTQAEFSAIWK